MSARCLCGLVDWEALCFQEIEHNTTETAAAAAVRTKSWHLGILVIADGQNDEALNEIARLKRLGF